MILLSRTYRIMLTLVLVVFGPFFVAIFLFGAYKWDFSVPFTYGMHDSMFQLALAKGVVENGWVFINQYLGAPGIADWHYHAGGQSSSLHSIIMLLMSYFTDNAVKIINYYYFINFSLISLTTFFVFQKLGVNYWLSVSAGYIYSFLFIRLVAGFDYIFLSSYYMVPLISLVIIWSITGRYFENSSSIKEVLVSKKFLYSLGIVFLFAISDGYYAFFSILLLLFSAFVVFINSQSERLYNAFIPIVFAFLILSTVLVVTYPLQQYQKSHQHEFETILKQPFEAEVYSTSLKLMLTPHPLHNSKFLDKLGRKMVDSNNMARKFPSGIGWNSTGILGSIFLLFMFFFLVYNKEQDIYKNNSITTSQIYNLKAMASLGLFAFLCAIYGGIGTLIALVYPTIRAYDRMTLFMMFFIMVAMYYFVSMNLNRLQIKKVFVIVVSTLITIFSLWDQTPNDIHRTLNGPTQLRFVAEKNLIVKLENEVPRNSMIYNYPYSQYVDDGVAGNMRTYFHTKTLRWSNGAAKNSPADLWNKDMSNEAIETLIRQLPLFGFKAMVIDKFVLKDKDYTKVKNIITKVYNAQIYEDNDAQMGYFIFPEQNILITFDENTLNPDKVIIKNKNINYSILPPWIDKNVLAFLMEKTQNGDLIIDLTKNSQVFLRNIFEGNRIAFKSPIEHKKLLGEIKPQKNVLNLNNNEKLLNLDIKNNSEFDWKLNSGSLPITIGFHIFDNDGNTIVFDNGFRIRRNIVIPKNSMSTVEVDIEDLQLKNYCRTNCKLEFELLQEGNVWFSINKFNKDSKIKVIGLSEKERE